MSSFAIATTILILVYILIAIEKIPKSVTALLGAALMLLLKILDQEEAFHHIDFNVIFLLASMMIIVNVTNRTGVFHWLALEIAKVAKGHPITILIMFSIFTAVFSALLDNVTTVLLMAPITIIVCRELGLSIIPYFITEILASNIGGTATLIGDPPNIMVGSASGYDFMRFVTTLGPITIVIFIVFMFMMYFIFRKDLVVPKERMERVANIDNSGYITDRNLLIKCMIVLGLVVIGFMVHGIFHYEAATIAMAWAATLLIFTSPKPIFEEIEWTTIFFFIGLFIIVGGVVEVGLISWLAEQSLKITEGDLKTTTLLILWISGFFSAFIDNIPYTATMIPMVNELGQVMQIEPLWWALALGACLGGNGTIIGASANVIMSDIAIHEGYPITFLKFIKYGMLIMVMSLIISTAYLLFLFF